MNLSQLIPDYYRPRRVSVSETFGEAMLGNLVSPARGLFVYSPVLLLAFSGFALALRHREERLLSALLRRSSSSCTGWLSRVFRTGGAAIPMAPAS